MSDCQRQFIIHKYKPVHDKTIKMTCASEDSDQPGHPLSLISLRCPREESLGPWLPFEREDCDQTGRMLERKALGLIIFEF